MTCSADQHRTHCACHDVQVSQAAGRHPAAAQISFGTIAVACQGQTERGWWYKGAWGPSLSSLDLPRKQQAFTSRLAGTLLAAGQRAARPRFVAYTGRAVLGPQVSSPSQSLFGGCRTVESISVGGDGAAEGVELDDGTQLRSEVVLVNADPFVLQRLAGHAFPESFNEFINGLRKDGTTMKVSQSSRVSDRVVHNGSSLLPVLVVDDASCDRSTWPWISCRGSLACQRHADSTGQRHTFCQRRMLSYSR